VGIWDDILAAMVDERDAVIQMLDTSNVRVHQHAGCAKKCEINCTSRSHGGLTIKIRAVVDAKSLPIRLTFGAGEHNGILLASERLAELHSNAMLLADGAYDSDAVRRLVREHGAWANIPPMKNRRKPICCSLHLYRNRNQVERLINCLKHCRRIATRRDRPAANFLAFINLAAIRFWWAAYESTP